MPTIGSSFIVINKTWQQLKAIAATKSLSIQCEESNALYDIFAVEVPIVYTAAIYKGTVPDVIQTNYSQDQNDTDKAEFVSQYLPVANGSLAKLSGQGTPGMAPSKGLGGFVPDPANNPYSPDVDEIVGHYVDVEGSLVVRGQQFTDEGSYRDDFVGDNINVPLSGSVTFVNGSTRVTGVGTTFVSDLNRDNYIKLDSDGVQYWTRVERVPNDTTLVLSQPYAGSSATGTTTKTNWVTDPADTGIILMSGSNAILSTGTGSLAGIHIERSADFAPICSVWRVAISQRVSGSIGFIGFRDSVRNPSHYCDVLFDGTDNTVVTFRSAWQGDEQRSVVSLPTGLTTDQSLRYKIDLNIEYCSLEVNGVLIVKHEDHVPDMYANMSLCAGVFNCGEPSNTDMTIDTLLYADHDQVQIASLFQAPVPIIVREDQHTIVSKLTTTSTTANQHVMEYTVPAGKVMYLIGYRLDCEGTVGASPVVMGKLPLGPLPVAPGSVDGNIHRSFALPAGGTTQCADFGSNPRKLGVGGDTIVIAVTPTGAVPTTFYAALDFVLR